MLHQKSSCLWITHVRLHAHAYIDKITKQVISGKKPIGLPSLVPNYLQYVITVFISAGLRRGFILQL